MRRPLLPHSAAGRLQLLLALTSLPAVALRAQSHRGAAVLRIGVRNSSLPQWYSRDDVCADSPHGWADSMGNSCGDYEQRYYCTRTGTFGAGWWPVWGAFSNYAAQNKTAVEACCACGGGMTSCCPEYRTLEAGIAKDLAPLRSYATQLEAEVTSNVSTVGARAAEKLRTSLESKVINVSETISNASAQLRARFVADARARFDNQTAHRENLTEAAETAFLEASYAAARGAVDYGAAKVDTARLSMAVQGAGTAVHAAALKWEEAASTGKAAAEFGAEAVRQYIPEANSTATALTAALKEANAFLDASEKAREEARFSQQATAVAADVSEVARAQSEGVDAQVRQGLARAQTALRATGSNVAKLDTLEALVAAAEVASRQVRRPAA
mmetsp:Transcript_18082/g.54547  ORF Transcript_18082/g.54547 Transcript_18082/m.54547 type:complete len:386 (+) Transcript_18082:127-1284(+)